MDVLHTGTDMPAFKAVTFDGSAIDYCLLKGSGTTVRIGGGAESGESPDLADTTVHLLSTNTWEVPPGYTTHAIHDCVQCSRAAYDLSGANRHYFSGTAKEFQSKATTGSATK